MPRKQASSKPAGSKKKTPKQKPTPQTPATQGGSASDRPSYDPPQLPFRDQQRLLDVFAAAFAHELSSPDLEETLQGIKGALFNRDFAAAFGKEENLGIYAARWSPTRALCYASILLSFKERFSELVPVKDNTGREPQLEGAAAQEKRSVIRVISIGGAAAELASFSSLLADHLFPTGEIVLLDSGPWATVVDRLHESLTTPPTLSSHASEAAIAANKPFANPESLTSTFDHRDILSLSRDDLAALIGDNPPVVTLLFTLNELYTSGGIGKTTTFLLDLSSCAPVGTLLLVVDSPGSYAETGLGAQAKRYPMQWLLDHTLLKSVSDTWERLESCDSVWFRLAESLRYPIPLENMRYQLHLYRVMGRPPPS